MKKRDNDEWLAVLGGAIESSADAIQELQTFIENSLRKLLRHQSRIHENDIQDLAQESFLRIVKSLKSFRGDSAFTTWAIAISTRVAFTELRKRKVRDGETYDFKQVESLASEEESVEEKSKGSELVVALRQAIDSELSSRQRVAILAELKGIPTVEIADQLDTNQNALYKLVHDGRKKLRAAMIVKGFTVEDLQGIS